MLRKGLVITEIALAVVLVVGSGLMIRTFLSLHSVDPGFDDPDHLQMFRVNIPVAEVPNAEEVMRMHQEILNRVAAIPGVESAALVRSAPMEGFNNDLKPLYEQVHGWAKYKLAERYKQPPPKRIPAHWIGNRWAQAWPGLTEAVDLDGWAALAREASS